MKYSDNHEILFHFYSTDRKILKKADKYRLLLTMVEVRRRTNFMIYKHFYMHITCFVHLLHTIYTYKRQ